LREVADVELLERSLRKAVGSIALEIVQKDATGIIQAARRSLENVVFKTSESQNFGGAVVIEGTPQWSDYELALMRAIGLALKRGAFFDEIFQLIQETDQASRLSLIEQGNEDRPSRERSNLFQLYVFDVQSWPTSVIVVACHNDFRGSADQDVIRKTMMLVDRVSQLTPGQLYLICLLCRCYAIRETACAEMVAPKLPTLFRACWATRIYHLQLEALQLLESYASVLDGPVRVEIEAILIPLESEHLFISTAIVETMSRYGLVESPIATEDARNEIAEILLSPDDHIAQEKAHRVVTNQFEDVYQNTYYEAVQELEHRERLRLLTMAALGSPSYSFWLDYILEELIKAKDPYVLAAFEKWATEIDSASAFIQGPVRAYVLACIGCANFREAPPFLKQIDTDDQRAWQTYGEIIFWLHKPDLDDQEIRMRCSPLWDLLRSQLPFQAVDPIMRITKSRRWIGDSKTSASPDTGEKDWFNFFKESIYQILEYGLAHRHQLTTLFVHVQEELTTFMIERLGEIGTSETLRHLEPLIDSDKFGVTAVEAIRKLKEKTRT
jgi:hypothetical protein